MKKAVMLSIRGRQSYADQEPEVIELITEGTLEEVENGWELSYEESDLTGLRGVRTIFHLGNKTITLIREGKLNSQMVFQEGVSHDSLYQMEFGALMLTVCAIKVEANVTADGGVIDLVYNIEIEQNAAGVIDYHLDIKAK
ncbi:MAG: DUF1934 domain-containing protein [Oscillospiraceae bacterium]|nr:DUF1934 domain-containing protein [Oscillospiraceae bacterium]